MSSLKKITRMEGLLGLGDEVIYVIKKPISHELEIIGEWESQWWQNLNPKRLQCQRDCKQ